MGVFRKLKDVLFDIEEEEELPKITRKPEQTKVSEPDQRREENTIKEVKVPREERMEKPASSFNFPLDVDETPSLRRRDNRLNDDYDDFFTRDNINTNTNINPRREEPRRRVNVRESFDYVREEPKTNTPFKPTPIISPVYGILDQNYSKDDVIVKTDIGVKGPNLDEVRKKAYGIEKKKRTKDKVTKEEFDNSLKTLDEILMEDQKTLPSIDIPELKEEEVKPKIFEEELPNEAFGITNTKQNIDDTIETDLFNLIDSMYEDREERED